MAVVPLTNGNLPTQKEWEEMKKTHIFNLGYSPNWDASGHLHQTVTRDDNVWAVDLGKNKIYHFKRDATTGIVSKLLDEADVNVDVGEKTANPTKPRHIALHPTKPVAFVVLEGASYVLSYAIEDDGKLVFKHKVKLTKQWTKHDSHYGSEIVVSPDGNFVYASSRCNPAHPPCDGIIAVYKVMEGTEGVEGLKLVEEYKLEQKWPRSMVLTPGGDVLAVALEAKGGEKDKVTTLKLNRSTGKIEKALHTVGTGKTKATFITFA